MQAEELRELKEFVADLKADRATQKEKEKREAWTKYTSMSLVFIAVLAAIATTWAGKYSSRTLVQLNKSTFHQALASDQWSYYQASSIKQNLYQSFHEVIAKDTPGTEAEIAKREKDFNGKFAKYSDNKTLAEHKAKEEEGERDAAQKIADDASKHGSAMGLATSIFQISIAMGSICLVVKKKWLWYVSLSLAVVATVQMILVWVA